MLIENNSLHDGIQEIYNAEQNDELKELYLVKFPMMIKADKVLTFEEYKKKVTQYSGSAVNQEFNRRDTEEQVKKSQNILDSFKPKVGEMNER